MSRGARDDRGRPGRRPGQDDEAEEKPQAQELRQRKIDADLTVRINQQFDRLVFGNGGWEPGARREFEVGLAREMDQFERLCGLTESQKKKLLAAGRRRHQAVLRSRR